MSLREKAAKIKLLILDMDGVMTNGQLYVGDDKTIHRRYSVLDGQAILWLQEAGIKVAIITTCRSEVVAFRAAMLKITHVYQVQDKLNAYLDLIEKLQLRPEEVAYIGDDLPDLAIIRQVGLGITVPNAAEIVRAHSVWCTEKAGGNGAIREVCEFLMQAQGTFKTLLQQYHCDELDDD